MSGLSVFSGKCLMAVCGEPTGICDTAGTLLFTGDIVIVFSEDYVPDGLTAVVSDQWQSYSDGNIKKLNDSPTYFVMGIKSVPLNEDGEWRVLRVKSFSDCIEGEHWPAYGFNYSQTPEQAIAKATGESA